MPHCWAGERQVEAEDGINTAIGKIRRAIDDNADERHYIQAFVGRGYQFIGDVKDVEDGGKIAGEGSCPLLRMVFHNGKAGVIQIDEDITRITFPAVRLNVNVAALLVAHAQKSYRSRI